MLSPTGCKVSSF